MANKLHHNVLGLISDKQLKIAGWCQWNTYRKSHGVHRLIT